MSSYHQTGNGSGEVFRGFVLFWKDCLKLTCFLLPGSLTVAEDGTASVTVRKCKCVMVINSYILLTLCQRACFSLLVDCRQWVTCLTSLCEHGTLNGGVALSRLLTQTSSCRRLSSIILSCNVFHAYKTAKCVWQKKDTLIPVYDLKQ